MIVVSQLARPYPVTQRGGIRAVAMATPGIVVLMSFLAIEMIPATPPKKAMRISSIVGSVLASISDP
jgi:hypothetical protein